MDHLNLTAIAKRNITDLIKVLPPNCNYFRNLTWQIRSSHKSSLRYPIAANKLQLYIQSEPLKTHLNNKFFSERNTYQPIAECIPPFYPKGTCKGMWHCFSPALWQDLLVQLFLQHLLVKNRVATDHSSHWHTSDIPLPSPATKCCKWAKFLMNSGKYMCIS